MDHHTLIITTLVNSKQVLYRSTYVTYDQPNALS